MHDVSSLSGFIYMPNHEIWIFSIVINGVPSVKEAKALEDKILLRISLTP